MERLTAQRCNGIKTGYLSLIHISEPTRRS